MRIISLGLAWLIYFLIVFKMNPIETHIDSIIQASIISAFFIFGILYLQAKVIPTAIHVIVSVSAWSLVWPADPKFGFVFGLTSFVFVIALAYLTDLFPHLSHSE